MDLLAIEKLLPNGFHDAYLLQLTTNFVDRQVDLLLSVLVANDDEPSAIRYRKCKLTLESFAVAILEPAVAYRNIGAPRGLGVDRTELTSEDYRVVSEAGYNVPHENFWLALFVYEWNSRIIVNARDATLDFI